MTDREYEILSQYVRDTADALGLKDWTMHVRRDPVAQDDDEGEVAAAVEPTYGRKHAVVWVCERFVAGYSADEQRHDICHELLHLHLRGVRDVPRTSLWKSRVISNDVYQIFMECFEQQIELAVDGMTDVIAKHIPVIQWDGESTE